MCAQSQVPLICTALILMGIHVRFRIRQCSHITATMICVHLIFFLGFLHFLQTILQFFIIFSSLGFQILRVLLNSLHMTLYFRKIAGHPLLVHIQYVIEVLSLVSVFGARAWTLT